MGIEGLQQINESEHLKYLEPTPDEVFHTRNEIQWKLMARFFGFEINDDPDPEKNKVLANWVKEYAVFSADTFKKRPELLMRYLHGDCDDVVDELFRLMNERHEVHA